MATIALAENNYQLFLQQFVEQIDWTEYTNNVRASIYMVDKNDDLTIFDYLITVFIFLHDYRYKKKNTEKMRRKICDAIEVVVIPELNGEKLWENIYNNPKISPDIISQEFFGFLGNIAQLIIYFNSNIEEYYETKESLILNGF